MLLLIISAGGVQCHNICVSHTHLQTKLNTSQRIGDASISAHCRGHAVCNLVLPDVYDYRILWRDANFWFQWTQKHLNKTGRSIADRLPLQFRNSDIQQSLSIDRQWPVRYSRQTPRRLTHSQPLSRFCYLNQLDVTVCRTLR